MKKIISLMLAVLMICFTACGEKQQINIVKSENTEKLTEISLPKELNRGDISLLSFDGEYAVFAVNRNSSHQVNTGIPVETVEIIVYDIGGQKTILYKNLDFYRAVVGDALYYDGILYYSVIDMKNNKIAVNMLEGFDVKEIYSFTSQFTGYSYGEVEFFTENEKVAFASSDSKTFVVENGKAKEFESDYSKQFDLSDMVKEEDELIFFHEIGDMLFVYTGNTKTGKKLAVKHLPTGVFGDIDYMACDYIESNKENMGFFIQWDGTSSKNKWYNKIDIDDMTVTVTKMDSPVDLGTYYVTKSEVAYDNALFLVNNPEVKEYKLLIYEG